VYKAIRKDVKVNGRRQKQDYMLQEGDEISLYIPDEELARYHPPRLQYGGGACAGGWPGSEPGSQAGVRSRARKQFSVAYEDEHLLIVNKPPGLLTHGDRKEKTNHLTNQVIAYLIGEGSYDPREKTFVPAPVNRLDRNTAGLVIFPKTYDALKAMNQVIHDHRCIRKFYLTIVAGQLEEPLHLEGNMSRDELRNMTLVGDEGKYMETMVEPLQKARGFTLCRVEIRTGRTHQIRVQFSHAGHPLCGDGKYGSKDNHCTVALFSHQLTFKHPITNRMMYFRKFPEDRYPWNLFDSLQKER
jgi:23S rRNA pseudouridine955/2504/2580 synthase